MPADSSDEPVRIPISGELDLHTFQPRDVPDLLGSYLAECVRTGRNEVRIIHGKGTGTLRETVHALLRRSPLVASFRLGDEHSGGWGATWAVLGKPRSSRRPSGPPAVHNCGIVSGGRSCEKAGMSTTLLYALIMTAAQIVFNLVLYFLGFEGEKIASLQTMTWIGILIPIICLTLGLRATRDSSPDRSLSFGRGVGVGTLMSLYSGIMVGIYRIIHLKYVNPSLIDYQMDLIKQKWVAAHMSDAQMESAEKITRMFMGPAVQCILTIVFSVIFGVILSLIIAAIVKRDPPPAVPQPA
ncbi:MAG TPA: DUF4199 family protein [Candidatus Didemnitutus sp.]